MTATTKKSVTRATEPAARVDVHPYTLLGADGRPYQSDTPGLHGGNRRGKLYGRLDCRAALRAIERGGYLTQRVFFADEPTAIAAGYRPCAVCLADTYVAWNESQPHI
jgi:hypothetical protein